MWAPTRGALVGLGAWVCLDCLLVALFLFAATLLLLLGAVLRRARKTVSRVRFEKVILHVLQIREKRGQALVGNGRVGGVVCGKTHPLAHSESDADWLAKTWTCA